MNNRSVTIEVDEIVFTLLLNLQPTMFKLDIVTTGMICISNIIRAFMREQGINEYDAEKYIPTLSSSFYAAAWSYVNRGILVRNF